MKEKDKKTLEQEALLKEKKEKIKERDRQVYNSVLSKIKNVDIGYVLITFLMLLLPSFILAVIALFATVTYGGTLFLIFFILPMFLAVEKRIKYAINGIGKKDITFADGYKIFFHSNVGGTFGVLTALLLTIALFLLCFLAFSNLYKPLCSCFEGSTAAYESFYSVFESELTNIDDVISVITNNIAALMQPLSLVISLSFFIPMFFLFMFVFPENLSYHYISTIVLPDIDNNMTASQGRAFARINCSRAIISPRAKINFKTNWIYFAIFTLLYAISTYLTSLIRSDNMFVALLSLTLTPVLSTFYGSILSFFTLFTHYQAIEELKSDIKVNLDPQFAMMIYQVYTNPNYQHREESFARGCFVDSIRPMYSAYNVHGNVVDEKEDENKQENVNENKQEEKDQSDQGTTIFVDLSDQENSSEN